MESKYDYFFKLVIIGDSGVGKTSLLLRIADALTESYNNTLVDFKFRYLSLDGKIVKLQIQDSPRERHRILTTSYYRATHGIFLVYDVTDPASYQNVEKWLEQIHQFAAEDVCIMLVGNKSDMIENKAVDAREAKKYAETIGIPFVETSAKRSTNVEHALSMLAAVLKSQADASTKSATPTPSPRTRNSKPGILRKLFQKSRTNSFPPVTPHSKPAVLTKSSDSTPPAPKLSLLNKTRSESATNSIAPEKWPNIPVSNLPPEKWPNVPTSNPQSSTEHIKAPQPVVPHRRTSSDLSSSALRSNPPGNTSTVTTSSSASTSSEMPSKIASPRPSVPRVRAPTSPTLTGYSSFTASEFSGLSSSSSSTSSTPPLTTSTSATPPITTSTSLTLLRYASSSTSSLLTASAPVTLTRDASASSPALLTSTPATLTRSPSSPTSTSTPSLRGAHGVLLIPSTQFEFSSNHEIGSGAQGVAYKTKWKSRDVVFKKLFLSHEDRELKRSFLRELEVWRNIHHPNSVALFGAVNDSNIVGYVMEYCANGNLQEHMKKGLVLSPLKTVDLACKIADILSVLHDSYIAHRDVKSANIMLDQDFNPKLGDFGLSQMVTTAQASATNLAGTPTHMAPEQYVSGAKHDPFKADVYSFGMLMYELATNQVPFHGLNQFEIFKNIEQGLRPSIATGTPVGLETSEQKIWWDLLTKCWAQDPLARPSMSDAHDELLRLGKIMAKRVQGFCCKAHKTGHHDFFLSYRVASDSNIVYKLYDSLTQTKRASGVDLKVFLDAKCLPDAEDWQQSFLYGLHHTKIIIPVISKDGLKHILRAHEENDNVLLEYEHMLSLRTLWKDKVKVFPIFIDAIPRAADYPDLPHITTGKNIRKTLERILRLQGKKIEADAFEEVIPALLEKLDELESGANSLSLSVRIPEGKDDEELIEVSVQVEDEPQKGGYVEVSPNATLESLRELIAKELDDFEFDYKFIKTIGSRALVISKKQEGGKTVKDIMDDNSNVILRKRL